MDEAEQSGRELFIGLVGAVGTDLARVTAILEEVFAGYAYRTLPIRLAELLAELLPYSKDLKFSPADDYIETHMNAGDLLRKNTGHPNALAVLALSKVQQKRQEDLLNQRRVFIFRSLKHPEEIETLRSIYGDSFYLVAAYASQEKRKQLLAQRISKSRGESPPDKFFAAAETLMWRDQSGSNLRNGQQVSKSFHRADIFVDVSDDEVLKSSLSRFVALVFGDTFHTPRREEYAMFHAKAAALRSSELGRQVGACISTEDGDIVSLGTNEVPRAAGGLYWPGDRPDMRQFQLGSDSNDDHKRSLIVDTLTRLREAKWLRADLLDKTGEELAKLATEKDFEVFSKDSRIANLIEFGRAVHGEMAALVDAARRGVSVNGCTMYVTTFPCHLCARHLVAAGIKKVVYIEPYAKSLTVELYPDSIAVEDHQCEENAVRFVPFLGISPRQYLRLFEASKRKDDANGKVLKLDTSKGMPRYSSKEAEYLELEDAYLKRLMDLLKKVTP